MIKRRLRVAKWLSTTPAVGVCTLCSREFKVPTSALRRTADAQASLQQQFDSHKCVPEDSSHVGARRNADVLLRQEPDEEEDEEEDDHKEEDGDGDEDDGYSE
jgi:hypothetical protein